VASHLSSLGFAVATAADLFALAHRLGPDAEPFDTPAGGYFRWADPSGAELWLQTTPGGEEFLGASPSLVASPAAAVTLTGRVPGEESPLDGAFRGTAGGRDVLFAAPDFRRLDPLPLPAAVGVHLAGFAHEAEGFPSPAAYRAADPKLHAEPSLFVPVGLLDAGPPRPLAFVVGVVTASDWRTNRLTGERFGVLELTSPVGPVAVALDPAVLAELPPAGGVFAGTVWLTGRVTRPPPAG
jgi:hypothetical protein